MTNKRKRAFYVTTFCNFAHWCDTGRPIGHECYVIPPRFLALEQMGEDWPMREREAWSRTRYFVMGRKVRLD